MTEYLSALMVCLQPINLLLIIAMVSLGIVFGAIPGLSATLGIALLLPVTFGLPLKHPLCCCLPSGLAAFPAHSFPLCSLGFLGHRPQSPPALTASP